VGGRDQLFATPHSRPQVEAAAPKMICAKAVVNFMSRPNIRIDRISGTISISGRVGQYSGRCEAYDPERVERRF